MNPERVMVRCPTKNHNISWYPKVLHDFNVKQGTEGPADMLQVDEADVHEGLRTHFPLSFGKQEAKSVSLETIHSKTKRVQPTVNNSSLVSTGNAACIFFVMKFSACQLVAGCWQLLYEGRLNK